MKLYQLRIKIECGCGIIEATTGTNDENYKHVAIICPICNKKQKIVKKEIMEIEDNKIKSDYKEVV